MVQEIYVIDDDESSIPIFRELFKKDKEYQFINVKSSELEVVLKNIPSIIIINEDSIKIDVVKLCQRIRNDEDNSITPIIVVSSNREKEHRVEILKKSVEYYIRKPVNPEYLYYTIKNLTRLLKINRRISPLTGLPGNVQIHAELKKRLANKEEFSVLYLDLDNFKAYNDLYGFLKGDEIIKFTADIILKSIHSYIKSDSFVGHIGGDDFIAIIPGLESEEICKNIIASFDAEVSRYFTKEDVKKGYMEVENRRGVMEQFPLTSISIGVVEADLGRFENILEIGEIGAQVKHLAKTIQASSYSIDRRRN